MRENSASPSIDNFPAVYWFWHDIPSQELIQSQLREIADAGFKTFLIQARLALPLDKFLSEAYLDAYRQAMEVARSLNLVAGLYDDYNWISGHGGGRTVAGRDDLREQHLFWSSSSVDGGKATCTISGIKSMLVQGLDNAGLEWIYEDGVMGWGKWRLLKVLAYPSTEGKISFQQATDLTDFATLKEKDSLGCEVEVDIPPDLTGGWTVTAFITGRCITSRLINYLKEDASKRFIDVAYEPFSKVMGEYFGDPLKFVFFDHPYSGFYKWDEQHGNIKNTLMFDDNLPSFFQDRMGYPFEQALFGSICTENRQSPRNRCDLFEIYSDLGLKSFFGPISAWTREHGLDLAGHELLGYIGGWGFTGGFGWVDNRVNFGGNYFSLDQYRTISTVDAFNNQAQLSAKMGDSVAKANGRRGCMIEQYYVSREPDRPGAVGQWDLTFHDYRAQAIRHHFLGASQFLYHGFYLSDGDDADFSLFSNPRYDFSPGINYEPWFRIHRGFADEMARLSKFLFEGDPANKIAILYPLRTYWAEGGDHAMQAESAAWNEWLTRNGFGFDVIDEKQILESEVHGSKISLGAYEYDCVILPGVSTVHSKKTIDKLEEFMNGGGTLFASGPLPHSSQVNGFDETLRNKIISLIKTNPNAHSYPMVSEENFNGFGQIREILHEVIRGYPKLDTHLEDQDIWLHYTLDDQDSLVAVYNDSQAVQEFSLWFSDKEWIPYIYSHVTGENKLYGWFDWDERGTRLKIRLDTKDFCLFRLQSGENFPGPHLQSTSLTVLGCEIHQEGNLIINLKADTPGMAHARIISQKAPELIGKFNQAFQPLPGNAWEVQFRVPELPTPVELTDGWIFWTDQNEEKQNIDIHKGWEQQGYPGFSGIGYYKCNFDMPELDPPVCWELEFDQVETVAEVILNDVLLGSCTKPPYKIDVDSKLLKETKNLLEVRVYNTAGNRYYFNTPYAQDRPTPSGIIGEPKLSPFHAIKLEAE